MECNSFFGRKARQSFVLLFCPQSKTKFLPAKQDKNLQTKSLQTKSFYLIHLFWCGAYYIECFPFQFDSLWSWCYSGHKATMYYKSDYKTRFFWKRYDRWFLRWLRSQKHQRITNRSIRLGFSKTLRLMVSAVTQFTKATRLYKSEYYTKFFRNAKTAGLCGESDHKGNNVLQIGGWD